MRPRPLRPGRAGHQGHRRRRRSRGAARRQLQQSARHAGGPDQTFILSASGPLARADLYKPLIVAWRNGAPVRLADIAKVEDSVENDKIASWLNGRRSIVLAVQRQPDANTVAVTDAS